MLRWLILLAATVVLIGVNGVFVAVEFAIVRVRRTRLEELAGQGVEAAKRAIVVVDQAGEYLATTQIGVTAASLGVGWLGETTLARLFAGALPASPLSTGLAHGVATASAFFLITTLQVVVGELVPKNLAITHAERLLLGVAGPLDAIHRVFRPLQRWFSWLSRLLLGALGHRHAAPPALTEEELKLVLQDSHEEGVVTDSEARIIARAFEFADKRAVEIMTSAGRVDFISLERPFAQNLAVARARRHARLPLCRSDLDSVVGVVSMKDAWPLLLGEASNAAFERSARPVVRIPLDLPQDAILRRLQEGGAQMGIVRDDADEKTVGVVTLEDVIESLLGDVRERKL